MPRVISFLVLLLLFCGVAAGQATPRTSNPVTVRGQVYAPDGAQINSPLRLELVCEDPTRPPQYYFTDSNGRFVLPALSSDIGYKLIVEGDGKNYSTTVERFLVLGPRFILNIHLRAPERDRSRESSDPIISVAELRQDVPRQARKEYEAAKEMLLRGESERARVFFERAIALFPDFVAARNELAVALLREGRLADAEAELRRALEVDADAAHPLLNLGLCLYRQQRYADALPYLDRAMQLEPVNSAGNLLLGIVLVMSGNPDRAEAVLLKAYEQGGKRVAKAQLYLSRLYTRRQDYVRAATALETYLNDVPDDPDAQSLRATLSKLRTAQSR